MTQAIKDALARARHDDEESLAALCLDLLRAGHGPSADQVLARLIKEETPKPITINNYGVGVSDETVAAINQAERIGDRVRGSSLDDIPEASPIAAAARSKISEIANSLGVTVMRRQEGRMREALKSEGIDPQAIADGTANPETLARLAKIFARLHKEGPLA